MSSMKMIRIPYSFILVHLLASGRSNSDSDSLRSQIVQIVQFNFSTDCMVPSVILLDRWNFLCLTYFILLLKIHSAGLKQKIIQILVKDSALIMAAKLIF